MRLRCLQERFLCGLRDAKLHDGLGRDFDFSTRRWIAARASGALDLYQLTETRNNEFAVLFYLGVSRFYKKVEESDDFFFGVARLGGELSHELRLGHFGHMCGNP